MMYVCELEDKLDSLKDAIQQLKNKQEHIKIRVKREESPYKERTYKIIDWLYRAERLELQSEKVIAECQYRIQKRWPACCCLINCHSSSKLGERICEKLKAVNQILTEDDFDVVVERKPHDVVDVIPVETTVDFQANLDDVWRCLEDASLEIIGIYGMAGIGKTTLMRKIERELGLNYPVVIWVHLSKGESIDTIQDAIASHLPIAIRSETWKNTNRQDRAAEISRLLCSMKFILMLDDLCDAVDLVKVGVPLPKKNRSKIIFSTRSEEVCNNMKAQIKLKLKCLSREEALKFFWMKAGEDIGNHRALVEHLADNINTELCQGLPLALTVIGRAMGRMRNPWDWEHAVSTMRNDPAELPGMRRLFRIIETSYASLQDNDMFRDCFMYCSILPRVTRKDELIKLWIGEGFLNVSDKNLGEYIIKRLKLSCLLESNDLGDSVSMHGVFRAFGLWLASEHGQRKNKILIQQWKSEKWSNAVRVSIYGRQLDVLRPPPNPCPLVQTLLIRDSNLSMFSAGFLHSMHGLGVLDLSRNKGTYDLSAGGIGSLINLHYLNLSHTEIKELPIEIENLKKLKVLLMDYTENFQVISNGVVSSVSSLQVFSKFSNEIFDDRNLLEELECIEHMADIYITLFSHEAIERILQSGKLQSCIRKLSLKKIKILEMPISTLSRMVYLEELNIEECEALRIETDSTYYYVLYLRSLRIRQCSAINNLQWLIFAPKLQTLELRSCESVKEIIGKDFKPEEIEEIDELLGVFTNMKQLHLEDLPSLESICPQILRFPVLKDVVVINCPRLLMLPFDLHCTKRLRQIKGSRSWDDGAARDMNSKFQDGGIQQSSDSMHSSRDSAFIEEKQVPEPINTQGFTRIAVTKKKKLQEPLSMQGFLEEGSGNNSKQSASTEKQRPQNVGFAATDGSSNNTENITPLHPPLPFGRINTPNLKIFTLAELKQATRNFRPDTMLGEGGLGRVFKGWIDDKTYAPSRVGVGMAVAVKKISPDSQRGLEEWQCEVKFLGKFSHPNLVKLLGYCWEEKQFLLVYEYMQKGSLENHLFRKVAEPLPWDVRLKVAIGAAKGLSFLHASEKSVIYRDFKTSNILLDGDFNAKLSDFGLAKLGPIKGNSHITTRVMGTYGYAAPEYVATGHLYVKSDVYGFGVVLLEMLTGLRALDAKRPTGQHNLIDWAKPMLFDKKKLKKLMDPRLEGQYPINGAMQAAEMINQCLVSDPQSRLSMEEVLDTLESINSIKEKPSDSKYKIKKQANKRQGNPSKLQPS